MSSRLRLFRASFYSTAKQELALFFRAVRAREAAWQQVENRWRVPISTFGDIAQLELELQVWCLSCKHYGQVDVTDPALSHRLFAAACFCCRRCGSLEAPSIVPIERVRPGSSIRFADVFCQRCVPPWEVREVRFDRPPWSSIDIGCQRYQCPGCGRDVDWIWHGGVSVPFSAGSR